MSMRAARITVAAHASTNPRITGADPNPGSPAVTAARDPARTANTIPPCMAIQKA